MVVCRACLEYGADRGQRGVWGVTWRSVSANLNRVRVASVRRVASLCGSRERSRGDTPADRCPSASADHARGSPAGLGWGVGGLRNASPWGMPDGSAYESMIRVYLVNCRLRRVRWAATAPPYRDSEFDPQIGRGQANGDCVALGADCVAPDANDEPRAVTDTDGADDAL